MKASRRRMLLLAAALLVAGGGAIAVWMATMEPRGDRDWVPLQSTLPAARFETSPKVG